MKIKSWDVAESHPKNLYEICPPNFALLAALYHDSFGPYVQKSSSGLGWIDWTNKDAVKSLTKTLLLHGTTRLSLFLQCIPIRSSTTQTTFTSTTDFNVDLEIPDDTLCPPVPNRLNYLCWIDDLLSSSTDTVDGIPNAPGTTVLDIGTIPHILHLPSKD